jgi:tetratricopeptide (TPR) repeat protein
MVLRALARIYLDMGRYQEADSLLAHAYAMHVSVNGPNHHHVGATLSDLAALRQHTGHWEKSASLYLEALAILRKNHRDEHIEVQEVFRKLAHLYEDWGQPEQAAKYRMLLVQPAPQR